MLRIGALLQQQQQQRPWGLAMMGGPGGRSVLSRWSEGLSVEIAACKGKGFDWNLGFRSSSGRTTTDSSSTLKRSRSKKKRRSAVAVMENSSMDQRATEAMELDNLVVSEPGSKWSTTLNSEINKASKWAVVALVAGGMLWQHDEHAVWFAIGSAVSGGFCKLLKYLINENRPPTADGVKADPGMPSSHAHGFFYLAVYASLSWLLWQGINFWSSITALGIVLSVAYLSWLRVEEGLHTVPQVLVGGTLGSAIGALWLYIWKAGVEAIVHSSSIAKFILYVAFLVAGVVCYLISFKDWEFGQP